MKEPVRHPASTLDLLSDIHHLLGTPRKAEELLARMADVLVVEYGAVRAELWRLEGDRAELAAASGAERGWPRDPSGPLRVQDPVEGRVRDAAFTALPGEAGGRPRAVLAVWTDEPPEGERRRVLDLFAEHAALALLDEESRARTERTVRQLAVLHAYARELQRVLDPAAVADALVRAVHDGLGFARALLFMRSGDRLTAFAAAGVAYDEVRHLAVPLDEPGLLREVVERREAVVVDEPKRDPRMRPGYSDVPANPNALIAVPLVGLGGEVVAVLAVDDGGLEEMVTPELVQALSVFAEQAALALQNASLLADTARGAATLEALVQATDAGVILDGPDHTIAYVNQRAEELIGLPLREFVGARTAEIMQRVASRFSDPDGYLRVVESQLERPEEPLEHRLKLVDGSILERQVSPVRDAAGRLLGQLVLYRDVTERERFIEELAGLAEISATFARGGELPDIMPAVHEAIARLMRVRGVALWRHDATERRFVRFGDPHGLPPALESVHYGDDRTVEELFAGIPVAANDLPGDPRFERYRDVIAAMGIRAAAAVPLAHQGGIWGVLAAYDPLDRPGFTDRDVRLLAVLGAQLSSFLRNAELTRRRMEIAEGIRRADRVASEIVAAETVDAVAARAAASVLDAFDMVVGRVWVMEQGELRLAAASGMATPMDALADEGGDAAVRSVAETRQPHLSADPASEEWVDGEWAEAEGIASYAAYPLLVGDELVGVICGFSRAPLPDELLDLLGSISRITAAALAKTRSYQEQRLIATVLQQGLIPAELPLLPGLRVSARYFSATSGAEVGGDLFDVFPLDHAYALFVADVSGKGIAASSTAAMVKHALRALATRESEPHRILEYLNRTVVEQGEGQFVTALLAIYDPASRRMWLSAAGHPPPVVRHADGTAEEVQVRGPALGLFAEARYVSQEVAPASGDVFVLYTDGVIECRRDGEMYGVERLVERVRTNGSAEGLADSIVENVSSFCGGTFGDDIALLVVGVE